ncbi:Na+/H+ antiporter subunit D [Rhizobium ruizarguesonis]|uniref:Na+/H+ antiporter subunit D n=1 Tax=Rhizobium ruizarguesonis TaxID=2081791 RepID=A0AAE5C2L7_9HYPH|nr:Na+/H+ antiporter subunit D [Rhizobium ruizarguesonis]TCA36986.1 Na+/H+ antiporter subunit D [Rhizobium leguminosarum bv. viciae]NEI49032.1 Na+/H+ antiporter subunit D [Rhizobium ruizarguesonis]TBC98212.1 Na+/H+ antiporter subunit D [Rhizobium ruizarguesonis]TBD15049.1 Na+/H+ antiporter subunit D [Rhizobium ruizarguesonis]TBE96104.1 Na+/H+ antiporter subunit D [Rhizobium ruizarguesonis]
MAAPTSTVDLSAALITTPVPIGHWLAILPVAHCITLGAVLLMLRAYPRLQAWLAIPGLAALVLIDAALLVKVAADGPLTMVMGRWLPPFGIAFTVDLFGALMAFTAALAALAGGIYALSDIGESGRRYGFFPLLMLLMAGVTGAFLTGDIFNLYVWFEVLLISSFGLIILGSEREQIDGALKYAVLNLIATTLFLIGVGILYAAFGTLNMADIAEKAGDLRGTAPLMTLASLFLLAFGMKAAAFPVNFWLPAAYHTPRIVVSALFAGLLTKVGIYALIRVMVMLLPVERQELSPVIALAAAATIVVGALGALAENDIRRLFGYVVISGIGNMLAGVALGGLGGISGAVFYALHSMVLMTALYLAAGEIARRGGGFSLSALGGLYRQSGGFTALSLVLFLAACGLPPFSGFWPKVILVKASLDLGAWWLAASILVGGFLTTIAFGRLFLLAYWRPAAIALTPSGPRWRTGLPLAALTALVVGFGILPEQLLALSQSAAAGLADPQAYLHSVFPEGGAP